MSTSVRIECAGIVDLGGSKQYPRIAVRRYRAVRRKNDNRLIWKAGEILDSQWKQKTNTAWANAVAVANNLILLDVRGFHNRPVTADDLYYVAPDSLEWVKAALGGKA